MVDGIWYVEIFGLYGWESIGYLVLNEGHVVGAGDHHHAVGSYTESDGEVSVSMTMNYKDVPRTLFGEAKNRFKVVFEGTHTASKKRIQGFMQKRRKSKMKVACRCTKTANIPWLLNPGKELPPE